MDIAASATIVAEFQHNVLKLLSWLATTLPPMFPQLDGLSGQPGSIPKEGSYTIETNVVELGWHEREFRTRSSFGFAAITHDYQHDVGCMYLCPSPNPDDDAVGISWARWDPSDPTAVARFFDEFRSWVERDWPFPNVAYPGRSIRGEKWLCNMSK